MGVSQNRASRTAQHTRSVSLSKINAPSKDRVKNPAALDKSNFTIGKLQRIKRIVLRGSENNRGRSPPVPVLSYVRCVEC